MKIELFDKIMITNEYREWYNYKEDYYTSGTEHVVEDSERHVAGDLLTVVFITRSYIYANKSGELPYKDSDFDNAYFNCVTSIFHNNTNEYVKIEEVGEAPQLTGNLLNTKLAKFLNI